jgi:hypothetical protein
VYRTIGPNNEKSKKKSRRDSFGPPQDIKIRFINARAIVVEKQSLIKTRISTDKNRFKKTNGD